MSDALTDGYRMEREWQLREKYYRAIKDYVAHPDSNNMDLLVGAATAAAVTVNSKMRAKFAKLVARDKNEWAKLLVAAWRTPVFDELKKISPFKDSLIINFNHGYMVHVAGLEDIVAQAAERSGVKSDEECLVDLPKFDPKAIEVFWLRHDISVLNDLK